MQAFRNSFYWALNEGTKGEGCSTGKNSFVEGLQNPHHNADWQHSEGILMKLGGIKTRKWRIMRGKKIALQILRFIVVVWSCEWHGHLTFVESFLPESLLYKLKFKKVIFCRFAISGEVTTEACWKLMRPESSGVRYLKRFRRKNMGKWQWTITAYYYSEVQRFAKLCLFSMAF